MVDALELLDLIGVLLILFELCLELSSFVHGLNINDFLHEFVVFLQDAFLFLLPYHKVSTVGQGVVLVVACLASVNHA